MINNKTLFEIYLILRLIIFSTLIITGVILITASVLNIAVFQSLYSNVGKDALTSLVWFSVCCIVIDERIKPAYIEFHFLIDEIRIKSYHPHSNRWESPYVSWVQKEDEAIENQ